MDILFEDKDLKKCATDKAYALKRLGQRRAQRYVDRLAQISDAANFESLRGLPGHYHDLVGDRAGQWACDLDHPYRLIFKSTNEGPVAQIVWANERTAKMLEIVDYHG
ncbi:type II toxin-antitoxin system RelE/ParE family toxin [Fibrobacter sp.]|uniref:type II toxin-antitoxin system RelE/ParE family toxin n=1 Tax=Fibrobacter sp. TaxID=35828 RepID=UPI003864B8DD